jgi:hypothetical protein
MSPMNVQCHQSIFSPILHLVAAPVYTHVSMMASVSVSLLLSQANVMAVPHAVNDLKGSASLSTSSMK